MNDLEPNPVPTSAPTHDYRAPRPVPAPRTLHLEDALHLEEFAEERTILRDKLLVIADRLHKRPSWQLESVLFEMAARQLNFEPRRVAEALCELINTRNWVLSAYRRNPDRIEIVEIRDLVQEADKLFCTFMRNVLARCS